MMERIDFEFEEFFLIIYLFSFYAKLKIYMIFQDISAWKKEIRNFQDKTKSRSQSFIGMQF